MSSIYVLTLRQLAGRGRLLIMTILSIMPVLIALVVVQQPNAPSVGDFEQVVLSTMICGSIIPLVVLAIAAATFANEVEDRTLANLTLTPLARWQIVLPKVFASITLAGPFVLLTALATSYVAFLGDARAMFAVSSSAMIAVALYSVLFVWLGLVSTQAIGIGLLYIVLWEGFFSGFIQGVRMLSIRHYAIAVMHALDARRFAWTNHLGGLSVSILCTVILAGFVLLSIRRLRTMDVP